MTTYAAILKTHFWSSFCERQLERLKAAAPSGDVFVAVDETHGDRVDVSHDKVVSVTTADLERLALPAVTTHGSVIWYNIDYPHYVVADGHPDYDYYVFMEYDAVSTVSFDAIVGQMAAEGIDYAGFPLRITAREWPWYEMHRPIFGDDFDVALSCVCILSKRAVDHLHRRRQEQGKEFAAKTLGFWPNNEAFIPTEIARSVLRSEPLTTFGDTSRYDWWPPLNEDVLEELDVDGFIHPVLTGKPFLKSTLHHERSLMQLVWPRGALREKLSPFPASMVREIQRKEISRRLTEGVQRRLERIGLRAAWHRHAASGTEQAVQTRSLHN